MFSEDSDVDVEDVQLTINEHYAKAYEHRKEREELEKRTSHVHSNMFRSNPDPVLQSKRSTALTSMKTATKKTLKMPSPRTKTARS